ncbi:hypothetical protein [Streptomyces sp. TRM64462]|uniref:hypothetical protein n=1 Tax=Streptomyces sp. TRM64462 TaxID=2741726 RepID=UPI001585D35F|nr:hypothetical protein [Streptomyces sp. TRM64462]
MQLSRTQGSPAQGSRAQGSRAHIRVALAASGWVALAATALPGGWPLRWVPVLVFVALGPGLALLVPRPGGGSARLETVALAAPLSLALAVLTATSLFLLEAFSVALFLGALAAFTTAAAALPGGVPRPAARAHGTAPPEVPAGESR